MPIVGLAIQIASVLAHGGDHDAVVKCQWAAGRTELKGGEKLAHDGRVVKIGRNNILSPTSQEKTRTVVEQCGLLGGAESRNRTGTVFCTGRF